MSPDNELPPHSCIYSTPACMSLRMSCQASCVCSHHGGSADLLFSLRRYYDRKGEIPDGSNGLPYFELPVFNYHEVRAIC